MKEITSKKRLEMVLSRLKGFSNPKVMDEQYNTDASSAAMVIWHSHMKKEIFGKTVADLGCGTGILGIGMLLMGAKKAYFIDKDHEALETCENNLNLMKSEGFSLGDYEIVHAIIDTFAKKTDMVIQNPPFGTKVRHADKEFLVKAFEISDLIYSFHKSETSGFVGALCDDYGYKIAEKIEFAMPLKAQFSFHRRKIQRIDVSCFCIVKKM